MQNKGGAVLSKQLKELLDGSKIVAINDTDSRNSICEFVVNKNKKRYSFTLYSNDLGVWIGNHKHALDSYNNFRDFIEEAFTHLSDVENYSKNIYESVDFPMEKDIGFKCKKCGKLFKISITAVKKSEYGDLLQTPEQRKDFAKILSRDYLISKESTIKYLKSIKKGKKKVKLKFSGYKSYIGGYSKLNGFEISLLNLDKFEEQFSKCFVMDKGDGINFVKHEIDTLPDKDKIRFLEILSQYGEKCDEDPGFGGDVEKEIKRMHRLT